MTKAKPKIKTVPREKFNRLVNEQHTEQHAKTARQPPTEYVLIFAVPSFYQELPRHCLLVKKPPNSMHAGLFNLPGGKLLHQEMPLMAAIRELQEETGLDGSFPKQLGKLLILDSSSQTTAIIHVVSCLIQESLTSNHFKADDARTKIHTFAWIAVNDLRCNNTIFHPGLNEQITILANLRLIIPLCLTGMEGWEILEVGSELMSRVYMPSVLETPHSGPNRRFET